MAEKRDWYTYYFKVGNKIVHGGRTQDLNGREEDHRQKWPKGHIFQVGECKTEDGAIRWERRHGFS